VVAVNSMGQPATSDTLRGRQWPAADRRRLLLLTLGSTLALAVVLKFSLTARHRSLIYVLPERIDQAVWGLSSIPRALVEVFLNSQNLGPRVGAAWVVAGIAAVLLGLVAPLHRSVRVQALLVIVASSLMLACATSLVLTGVPYRALHGFFPVAPF